jgi:uncharacterized membrane protein
VRFVALDRLRALAVVLMVQGHTFTALMRADGLRDGLGQLHALVHGLTAPAFLFGAGLAFGVATYRDDGSSRVSASAGRRRLFRYARVFAIGYLLQLPGASLTVALRLRGDALWPVLRVGPLQLIAVCMLMCQLLAFVCGARRHAYVCAALGLATFALTPLVWEASLAQRAPMVFASWFDDTTGSLFPLFPWAAFVFLGVATAELRKRLSLRGIDLTLAGFALAGLAYAMYRAGYRLSSPPLFWKASPLNMSFRLGLVVALLGVLHIGSKSHGLLTALLSRHSLVAYVTHLLILYGTPFTPSLVRSFAGKLDVLQASAVCGAVLIATALVSYGWSRLGEPAQQHRWFKLALVGCGLMLLVR